MDVLRQTRSAQTMGLARPSPGIAAVHRTPRPLGMSQADASGKPSAMPSARMPRNWGQSTPGFGVPAACRATPTAMTSPNANTWRCFASIAASAADYNPRLAITNSLAATVSVEGAMSGQIRALAISCAVLVAIGVAPPRAARSQSASPAPSAARLIDLESPDGIALKASYFASGRPGPGILLFHACNSDRSSWNDLAAAAAARGFHVIA